MSKGIIPTIQPSIIFKRSAYFKHVHNFNLKICADGELLLRMACDSSLSMCTRNKLIVNFHVRESSFGNLNTKQASAEIASFSKASFFDRWSFNASKHLSSIIKIPW
jgi:hypothetical protein